MNIAGYDLTIVATDPTAILDTTYTNTLRMGLALHPLVPTVDIPVEVTLTNPCQSTTLSATTNPIVLNHVIGDSATELTLLDSDFTDSQSFSFGNGDGYTLCGPRTFSLSVVSGAPLTFDETEYTLTLVDSDFNSQTQTFTDTLIVDIVIQTVIVETLRLPVESTIVNACQQT